MAVRENISFRRTPSLEFSTAGKVRALVAATREHVSLVDRVMISVLRGTFDAEELFSHSAVDSVRLTGDACLGGRDPIQFFASRAPRLNRPYLRVQDVQLHLRLPSPLRPRPIGRSPRRYFFAPHPSAAMSAATRLIPAVPTDSVPVPVLTVCMLHDGLPVRTPKGWPQSPGIWNVTSRGHKMVLVSFGDALRYKMGVTVPPPEITEQVAWHVPRPKTMNAKLLVRTENPVQQRGWLQALSISDLSKAIWESL